MMSTVDRFMVARGIELARAGRHVAVNLSADSINGRISGGGCDMRLTNQNGNIDILKRP